MTGMSSNEIDARLMGMQRDDVRMGYVDAAVFSL